MNTESQGVEISLKKIREAAWELWSWIGDESIQELPIEMFDDIIIKVIETSFGEKISFAKV